eukprot:scaffold34207_cov65-Isochrysis_galbana.AAC.1
MSIAPTACVVRAQSSRPTPTVWGELRAHSGSSSDEEAPDAAGGVRPPRRTGASRARARGSSGGASPNPCAAPATASSDSAAPARASAGRAAPGPSPRSPPHARTASTAVPSTASASAVTGEEAQCAACGTAFSWSSLSDPRDSSEPEAQDAAVSAARTVAAPSPAGLGGSASGSGTWLHAGAVISSARGDGGSLAMSSEPLESPREARLAAGAPLAGGWPRRLARAL